MDELRARKELPIWSGSRQARQEFREMLGPVRRDYRMDGFWRRYGLGIMVLFAWAASMMLGCCITGTIVRKNTEREVTERVTSELRAGFTRFLAEQEEQEQAAHFVTGEASLTAAMDAEADVVARAVGKMATKRMKLTMCWNILVRVDSPYYPDSVQEVVEQPQQWMFYDSTNPIKDDDRELVLEQLRIWHDGRYPAGLTTEMVYGEWSQTDYVLRDSWEKNSRTGYWRYPE